MKWRYLLPLVGLVAGGVQADSDPWENFNRDVYQFNDFFDRNLFKPVSIFYHRATPTMVKTGVHNFFVNLSEISVVANDFLQGEFNDMVFDTARFVTNTTIGVGGLIDVAGKAGIQHHHTDFGITLTKFKWTDSRYFVIPFYGPSTIRDATGRLVDYFAFSIWPHTERRTRTPLRAVDALDTRTQLLEQERAMETIAVDKYIFMRDAYMQHRAYLRDPTVVDNALGEPPL